MIGKLNLTFLVKRVPLVQQVVDTNMYICTKDQFVSVFKTKVDYSSEDYPLAIFFIKEEELAKEQSISLLVVVAAP